MTSICPQDRIPNKFLLNIPTNEVKDEVGRIFVIQSAKKGQFLKYYLHFYGKPERIYIGCIKQDKAKNRFYVNVVAGLIHEGNSPIFNLQQTLHEAQEVMIKAIETRYDVSRRGFWEFRSLYPFCLAHIVSANIPF